MHYRRPTRGEIIARLVSIQTLKAEMLLARYAPENSNRMLDDTRHEFSDEWVDLVSESNLLKTILGE